MADFFVTGNGKLKHEGLEFYKEFSQKRLFELIEGTEDAFIEEKKGTGNLSGYKKSGEHVSWF